MAFTSTEYRPGKWRAGFYHPILKKKIQKAGFDYEYEADAWALTAEERAHRQAAGEEPEVIEEQPARPMRWVGPTVADYGAQWLARRSVARQTRNKYAAHLAGLSIQIHPERQAPGKIPMGLLTRDVVEQWVTDSDEAGVGRPTINGRLALLRMLYVALFDSEEHHDGTLEGLRDPTRKIKFLTEDDAPDYVLTSEEEAEFLTAAREHSPQLAAAAIVALDAGLRWQEVYALRASAVSGEYLIVTHVIERGRVELRAFTKGKKPRVVPMTERLAQVLAPLVKEARKRGGPDALLFPVHGTPGRVRKDRRDDLLAGRIPWDYGNHRKREWLPVLAAIGAATVTQVPTGRKRRNGTPILQRRITNPTYGFHSLRHTYGSRLADASVPRAQIAELMGHADERTTGRYIHAGDDGRRLALVRAALGRRAAGLDSAEAVA